MASDSPLPILAFPPRPLRWMYIDFNSYFASVEQQINPDLRNRPIIVVPVETDSTCAIAASVEAKKYGIRTGTKVYEAKRLCPHILCVKADHRHYVDYHNRLIEEIWRHIPVTHVGSIDEVACRLLNNENQLDQVHTLAKRIKAGIYRNVGERLTCSIGVAPSPLLAKLASDAQKPDGMVIFAENELPDRLFAFELGNISGIGHNMERRLAAKGITTIEHFCKLGPRRAGALWGSRAGDRLWFELHGIEVPRILTQTRSLGHSHVLAPENRPTDKARLVMRRLTLKAASRMRRKNYQTGLVFMGVRFEQDHGKWKGAHPVETTQSSFALLTAVDGLWDDMVKHACHRFGCAAECLRFKQVSVGFLKLQQVDAAQPSLFPPGLSGNSKSLSRTNEALCLAMDTLNEKFGRNMVSIASNIAPAIQDIGTKVAFTRIPELEEFHE